LKDNLKIVGIGGSLEANSNTLTALKYSLEQIGKTGYDTELFDINELKFPIFNPQKGIEQVGEKLRYFLDCVYKADGYIFASPEYHGTVSGAFKNVIDYLEFLGAYDPPYLSNKPIGIIATGGGDISGITTIQSVINIAHNLRAIAASKNVAIVSSYKHFNKVNESISDMVKRRLKRLAEEVVDLAGKFKHCTKSV
jgi:FMN reductase